MKIRTSQYNEVKLFDVAQYIKVPAQIVKPISPNGVFIGFVYYEDGRTERVCSDYEVRINNVQLPFAAEEDSYFDRSLKSINISFHTFAPLVTRCFFFIKLATASKHCRACSTLTLL